MSDRKRLIIGVAFGAVLGLSALLTPAMWYAPSEAETGAFMPLMMRALKQLQPVFVFPFLMLSGFLAAYLTGQKKLRAVFVVGFSTILTLPLWSTVDMFLGDPNIERHNLLPFEWLFYCFFGGFGVIGGVLALFARRIGSSESRRV